MSVIAAWGALALCLFLAGLRIPDVLRGRNVPAFLAFVMISVVISLAIPSIYHAVDGALGSRNFANLLSHLILNATFLVVGLRVTKAVDTQTQSVLLSRAGVCVLVLASAGLTASFVLSNVPSSSMGLNAYTDQFWVLMYRLVGRLYPAFVAATLIGPSLAAAKRFRTEPLLRMASLCFVFGFSLVATLPLAQVVGFWAEVDPLLDAIIYLALLAVAVGPTLIWIANRRIRARAHGYIAKSSQP